MATWWISIPSIPNTTYHAAKDAWTLLDPRINNLETHGIYDARINDLQNQRPGSSGSKL